MSFEVYDVFDDPYTYPGSTVLRNLLDIQNQQKLDAFEVEMSSLRAEEPLPQGRFDSDHYCNIHRHLFQDVYAWAGQYRTVRTAKGNNAFCYPEFIAEQMGRAFRELQNPSALRETGPDEFVRALTRFLADVNAIHPFREGNGRSQLTFLGLVAAESDHPLDFTRIRQETYLPAIVASFSGQTDALEFELAKLL